MSAPSVPDPRGVRMADRARLPAGGARTEAGADLIRLVDADGWPAWYCRDCAPAAILGDPPAVPARTPWPAKLAGCNVSRRDAAEYEAARAAVT